MSQRPCFNFTSETVTLRENARKDSVCITKNTANDEQSILSSDPSIVGLIPTAVTLLGSRRIDIMAIHQQIPIIAFLLTFAELAVGREGRTASSQQNRLPFTNVTQELKQTKRLWNYLWNTPPIIPKTTQPALLAMHILSCLTVALLLWQT